MSLIEKIKAVADRIHPDLVRHRRHLHQHPELSYEEVETSEYIANVLTQYGYDVQRDIGGHGVVALISGQDRDGVVALRADIDALPIQEENDVPYRSNHAGKMHACGHDVHTTSLLGTSIILRELKDDIPGTIKLIFQPAEEKLPGGASLMIKDGVLERPSPSAIFGQHVHPPLAAGKIGIKSGMYMASADELYLTVKGRGGHAALPQDAIDPIVIASNIVVALQHVVSRGANPTIPSVITLGKIQSEGGATNIIPSAVSLEGTFRTMNEQWRFEAHEKMRQMVKLTAAAHGGEAELRIEKGYPFLMNEESLTNRFKEYARSYLGDENVVDLPIRMTAEDFAYYSQVVDACFYRLGTGNISKGITSPIHTPTFDVDESCLSLGSGLMAYCGIRELNRKSA